jgi:hypothetical protein
MKKILMIFIAILCVASFTTSAFAFDSRRQVRVQHVSHAWQDGGRYYNHGGYDGVHYRYDNYNRRVYPQPRVYYAPVYAPKPVVFVPPLPVPGIHIMFPHVSISIR